MLRRTKKPRQRSVRRAPVDPRRRRSTDSSRNLRDHSLRLLTASRARPTSLDRAHRTMSPRRAVVAACSTAVVAVIIAAVVYGGGGTDPVRDSTSDFFARYVTQDGRVFGKGDTLPTLALIAAHRTAALPTTSPLAPSTTSSTTPPPTTTTTVPPTTTVPSTTTTVPSTTTTVPSTTTTVPSTTTTVPSTTTTTLRATTTQSRHVPRSRPTVATANRPATTLRPPSNNQRKPAPSNANDPTKSARTLPGGSGAAPWGELSRPVEPSDLLKRRNDPRRKHADVKRGQYAAVFAGGLAMATAAGCALGLQRILRRRRHNAIVDEIPPGAAVVVARRGLRLTDGRS